MSPWTFEAPSDSQEESILQAGGPSIRFVTPAIQTFEFGESGSKIYGYTIDDPGVRTGHFVRTWDSLDRKEVQAKIARMACHFLVDLTPASGLEEMLEKTTEIREYHCSLEGWQLPAISSEVSVAANPEVASFVRDSFSFSEE